MALPGRHAIFRLVCGMDLRLHPVVWLLRRVTRSAGQTAPPPQGLHATTPVDAVNAYHDFASGVRDDRPIPSYTS